MTVEDRSDELLEWYADDDGTNNDAAEFENRVIAQLDYLTCATKPNAGSMRNSAHRRMVAPGCPSISARTCAVRFSPRNQHLDFGAAATDCSSCTPAVSMR